MLESFRGWSSKSRNTDDRRRVFALANRVDETQECDFVSSDSAGHEEEVKTTAWAQYSPP